MALCWMRPSLNFARPLPPPSSLRPFLSSLSLPRDSPALAWSFIHEASFWPFINGQDKPTICATDENPTLWFAVWGFKKAGPFTALEADDAVQSDLACYHRSTDPSWRAHMIPQWLMDACELVYEHLPASG